MAGSALDAARSAATGYDTEVDRRAASHGGARLPSSRPTFSSSARSTKPSRLGISSSPTLPRAGQRGTRSASSSAEQRRDTGGPDRRARRRPPRGRRDGRSIAQVFLADSLANGAGYCTHLGEPASSGACSTKPQRGRTSSRRTEQRKALRQRVLRLPQGLPQHALPRAPRLAARRRPPGHCQR